MNVTVSCSLYNIFRKFIYYLKVFLVISSIEADNSDTCRRLCVLFTVFVESKSFEENYKSAGVPPFVVQEEFDRYTGYWWQPKTYTSGNHVFMFVVARDYLNCTCTTDTESQQIDCFREEISTCMKGGCNISRRYERKCKPWLIIAFTRVHGALQTVSIASCTST